jgi:hypothetical protein
VKGGGGIRTHGTLADKLFSELYHVK